MPSRSPSEIGPGAEPGSSGLKPSFQSRSPESEPGFLTTHLQNLVTTPTQSRNLVFRSQRPISMINCFRASGPIPIIGSFRPVFRENRLPVARPFTNILLHAFPFSILDHLRTFGVIQMLLKMKKHMNEINLKNMKIQKLQIQQQSGT
jgi:hypothetical protein